MAKLIFRYGAMGSSKTANALMVRYNYYERDKKVVLLKPRCEARDGAKVIKSRIGLVEPCEFAEDFLENYSGEHYDCIIVDEVQFLAPDIIDRLSDLVDEHNITVICYGLRTDFQTHLFPGAKRLMELADDIEQIRTICWCGKRAISRFAGNIIRKDKSSYRYKGGGGFVMVPDGGDNGADLLRRHTQLVQKTERHNGAALGMVRPVDDVADIVHDSGNLGKLRRALVIAQLRQNHGGYLCHLFHTGKGMLRKAQAFQCLIRPADIGHNVRILLDVFVCDNSCHAYSFTPSSKNTPYQTRNINTVQIFRLLSAFPAR